MIDTHCHLNFEALTKDLLHIVRRAKEKGVEKCIVPGTDLASSARAVELAEKYPELYAAVGIHPHHAKDPSLEINSRLKEKLEKLIGHKKVVAIGEIGMDYHVYTKTKYEKNDITPELKQKQKELFLLQLDLAVIHKKPVIFHCREAFPDMIQTISSASRRISRTNHIPAKGWSASGGKPIQGVWHCFGGSKQDLRLLTTMGYYVGFDGNITYNSSLLPVVKETPMDKLLLETDAPFLTPIPYRSQRNEPMYLPLIAQKIAEIKGVSVPEVIHISTENTVRLFRLQ